MNVPPGPRGLPGVGSLIEYQKDPLGFLRRLSQDYGPISSFYVGPSPVYLVSDPELIGEVLLTNHSVMHKDEIYQGLKRFLGEGLVTSEDDVWKRHRKIAAKPFGKKQVDKYAEEMVALTSGWLQDQTDGAVVDIGHSMSHLTQSIVLRCLFGTDIQADTERAGNCIQEYLDGYVKELFGVQRLIPNWVPTPGRRRADQLTREMDEIIFEVVAAKRAQRDAGDDVLSRLLAAAEGEGGMSDKQLRDEAVTFYAAGHETTATMLTYVYYELSRHPDMQRRLYDEVAEVLQGQAPAAGDLGRLPYTQAVIREAMRVHPPIWAIGREPVTETVIGGYTVRPGTQLMVSTYVMHHKAEWFPEPDEFRPERWLDGLYDRLPRFVYLPFGGGPRICIGNHFAMLESTMMIARIAQQFSFEATSDRVINPVPSITLRPDFPVELTLRAIS